MERLARRLRDKMEHLDPTMDGEMDWEALSERQQNFYRYCIEDVCLDSEALMAVL